MTAIEFSLQDIGSLRFLFAYQPLQESEILFVAVWREVQCPGDTDQLLFFNLLFMLFHEGLVRPPRDARRFDRVAFDSRRDLMGMKVMEPQFV